jgi:hypothetical protein
VSDEEQPDRADLGQQPTLRTYPTLHPNERQPLSLRGICLWKTGSRWPMSNTPIPIGARYLRAEFGRSSEKLAREAEQLELAIEAVETDQAERLATALPAVAAAAETAAEAQKPARRPLPEHLPREDRRHPASCTCPGCGGALRKIADEVSETLDYVPGRFKVVRHVREKLSCRVCEVVAAPAPGSRDCPRPRRSRAARPYRRFEI